MKEFLKKLIEQKEKRIKEIRSLIEASQDINEVRSLGVELETVNSELAEARSMMDRLEADDQAQAEPTPANDDNDQIEDRSQIPGSAVLVNPQVNGSFTQNTQVSQVRSDADPFNTMEYRMAFKNYVQRGIAIPENLIQRDGMPANTDSIGATIPTTTLNEFINEIRKVYGNLYAKVRKMNIQGGVKVPISKLQATAKWITESTVSPKEDGGEIKDFVLFEYNILECRVSQTLLSSIVALDVFEREIVNVMLKAYLEAMDLAIVRGSGNGAPLGIINDPRVTNVVEMTAAEINDWTAWRKKFFAKLPLGYRAGEFIFPVSTVDAYLETMADANNNPIFRQATGLEVNDGDATNPNGRFFGREVSLVEPNVIPDFDEASSGDVIGVFWQPNEYAINTNMQFGMKRWFDDDANEWVNKMLTIVDGKVLNPKGIVLIKKK
jgi:HK97 family phage major capsid protein